MPTNLPDPRKREAQASEDDPLLYMRVAVMLVGMLVALILNMVFA
jgi:hypothetical protein